MDYISIGKDYWRAFWPPIKHIGIPSEVMNSKEGARGFKLKMFFASSFQMGSSTSWKHFRELRETLRPVFDSWKLLDIFLKIWGLELFSILQINDLRKFLTILVVIGGKQFSTLETFWKRFLGFEVSRFLEPQKTIDKYLRVCRKCFKYRLYRWWCRNMWFSYVIIFAGTCYPVI